MFHHVRLSFFDTDYAASDAGGNSLHVSLPGKRTVRVIKKCSKWIKLRKVAPKVGKLAFAFKDVWAVSQERHYTPGGKGYQETAERFTKAQKR